MLRRKESNFDGYTQAGQGKLRIQLMLMRSSYGQQELGVKFAIENWQCKPLRESAVHLK